jgi:hypothetical protein
MSLYRRIIGEKGDPFTGETSIIQAKLGLTGLSFSAVQEALADVSRLSK